jgi:hypothetical protein
VFDVLRLYRHSIGKMPQYDSQIIGHIGQFRIFTQSLCPIRFGSVTLCVLIMQPIASSRPSAVQIAIVYAQVDTS